MNTEQTGKNIFAYTRVISFTVSEGKPTAGMKLLPSHPEYS